MGGLAAVAALPTVDIHDVELCAAGTWNGRLYTIEEFDEAAKTWCELAGTYDVPLKLGHDDDQRLVQADGYPAIGWVANVRRSGLKLLGDYLKVPARLAAVIKAGGLPKRSCEFWLDTEFAGKKRPFMLKAVALLGADAPAVEGLEDVYSLYNSRTDTARTLAGAARTTVTMLAAGVYKTEGGKQFHVSDYAYTPDDGDPGTWKLRITKTPGGAPDAGMVGAAVAAFGKGFRGQKASIATADRAAVKSRLRGAWTKANPDKSEDAMPTAIKNARRPARTLRLASGPSVDDIQSAVEDALA